MSDRQDNATVNGSTGDQDFSVGSSGNKLMTNEHTVYVKTLERCFSGKIERKMSTIVDTVEDRIQSKSLTTIDNFIAPMIELVVM